MKNRAVLSAVLVLSSILAARAEEAAPPADDPEAAALRKVFEERPNPWAETGVGSWVEYKSTMDQGGRKMVTRMRLTLTERKGSQLVFEQKMLEVTNDGQKVDVPEAPTQTMQPADLGAMVEVLSLKKERTEDVDLEGQKVPCGVWAVSLRYITMVNGKETIGEPQSMSIWFAPSVKETRGVLKTESESAAPKNWSRRDFAYHVTAVAREAEVGGTKVRCVALKGDITTGNEDMVAQYEALMSDEVPGKMVRTTMHMTRKNAGAGGTQDVVMEATGFEVKAAAATK